MAATTDESPAHHHERKADPPAVRIFSICVVACFAALVTLNLMWLESVEVGSVGVLAAWIVVAALADTLRVRLWDEFSFAMSLPVTLAAGMVLSPVEAALVAFVGAFDTRDFTGGVPLERVLLNRAIAGLSIYAGSVVFHMIGYSVTDWPKVLIGSVVAFSLDFGVNIALVAFPVSRLQGVDAKSVLVRVLEPNPSQTIIIYLSVGLLAPVIALVSSSIGIIGVVLLLLPLGLARDAYLQLLRLNEAAQRLHDKNLALRDATQRSAEERRDERMILAGELHDGVLPPLFQVHLMGQVLRQDLARGRLLQLDDDLPALLAATDAAQLAIRGVVRDLRESPIGVEGLAATLRLVADQLESANPNARIRLEMSEVDGSQRALLVTYQVAKEALTNAVRHAKASSIVLRLQLDDDRIRLVVADDGIGFDSRLQKEDHFGLLLMRERVEAIGGNLAIASGEGQGTIVAVAIPPDA